MSNLHTDNGEFRFADWHPERGTVPAYFRDSSGLITLGEVAVVDGQLYANDAPIDDDGCTVELRGWRHSVCQSFDDGAVLVPLRGSRQ